MSDRVFSEKVLEKCMFNWDEMHEKSLFIKVGKSESNGVAAMCVIGYELKTGISYVLHSSTMGLSKAINENRRM